MFINRFGKNCGCLGKKCAGELQLHVFHPDRATCPGGYYGAWGSVALANEPTVVLTDSSGNVYAPLGDLHWYGLPEGTYYVTVSMRPFCVGVSNGRKACINYSPTVTTAIIIRCGAQDITVTGPAMSDYSIEVVFPIDGFDAVRGTEDPCGGDGHTVEHFITPFSATVAVNGITTCVFSGPMLGVPQLYPCVMSSPTPNTQICGTITINYSAFVVFAFGHPHVCVPATTVTLDFCQDFCDGPSQSASFQ